MPSVLPVCLSMIVCDQVAFDPVSGRPSILGVMHRIRCDRFPARGPRLVIFAELTNGRGRSEVDFSAHVIGGSEPRPIQLASTSTSVIFRDPLDVQITGALIDDLIFLAECEITVRMAIGTSVMMERRVPVTGRESP